MTDSTRKSVVLARGLGTRMRASADYATLDAVQSKVAAKGLKALMPLGDGRVMLDVILEKLRMAGSTEICLVIGPEHQEFRDFCADRRYDVEFAVQSEPRGTADAVLAAREFAGQDRILVVNSDNLYPTECLAALFALRGAGLVGFEIEGLTANGNIPEERVKRFATLETDVSGFLAEIIEKPDFVASDALVSMNCWIFNPSIFDACAAIDFSPRGELELTTAVMFAIGNMGEKFEVVRSDRGVLDLSSRADVASVASLIAEF